MMMALNWVEIWLMGILKFRDRTMKAMRLPRDRSLPPLATTMRPPQMASTAYWT